MVRDRRKILGYAEIGAESYVYFRACPAYIGRGANVVIWGVNVTIRGANGVIMGG